MTRKLEELFDLPPSGCESESDIPPQKVEETRHQLSVIDQTIDKIDQALPAVRGLDASDNEMDDLANRATQTFEDLMDLGMQVDSRYASEIFAVAGAMLGHALTAKTAKLNKKLKMVELQLKKAKMDQDFKNDEPTETGQGEVLATFSRNELLEKLMGNRDQKDK